jgi:hypothetical protein
MLLVHPERVQRLDALHPCCWTWHPRRGSFKGKVLLISQILLKSCVNLGPTVDKSIRLKPILSTEDRAELQSYIDLGVRRLHKWLL